MTTAPINIHSIPPHTVVERCYRNRGNTVSSAGQQQNRHRRLPNELLYEAADCWRFHLEPPSPSMRAKLLKIGAIGAQITRKYAKAKLKRASAFGAPSQVRDWHATITPDLRTNVIGKLVQTMLPGLDPIAMHGQRIRDAHRIEKFIFDAADDKGAYFRILGKALMKL